MPDGFLHIAPCLMSGLRGLIEQVGQSGFRGSLRGGLARLHPPSQDEHHHRRGELRRRGLAPLLAPLGVEDVILVVAEVQLLMARRVGIVLTTTVIALVIAIVAVVIVVIIGIVVSMVAIGMVVLVVVVVAALLRKRIQQH